MKIFLKCSLLLSLILISNNLFSQVGIGTLDPDASAALDISSSSKGLLIPRLTTSERNLIALPATGLMIYNVTMQDNQFNIGSPAVPNWIGVKNQSGFEMNTVTESINVSTTSSNNLLLPGMTLSPTVGTYMVLFNAQVASRNPFSTTQGITELNNLYQNLMATTGGVSHGLVFGNDEILLPGIYDVTGALSFSGTLTLDGGNDPNALFIIRSSGAITTGVNTIVNLVNNASASNVFWVSEGAISSTDPTIMKGILIANNAAVSLGANTNLEGKMFSTTGALSMGASSVVTTPVGTSSFNLGVLSSFAMFTNNGAVSAGATCIVTGDIGTGVGAITGFTNHTGTIYPADTVFDNSNIISSNVISTYSIFQNGEEIINSRRTINAFQSLVAIQTIVTVTENNNPIEVRWRVNTGEAKMGFRTLSLIRSSN